MRIAVMTLRSGPPSNAWSRPCTTARANCDTTGSSGVTNAAAARVSSQLIAPVR